MLAVLGPTASGKSEVAMEIARARDADIVSVDSMQVYLGMDIGTAKPSLEERAAVPHHMIDLVKPEIDFTVAEFQALGRRVLDEARSRERAMVIVGGSGLHFRSLVDPLHFPASDPDVRQEVDAMPTALAQRELLAADPEAPSHLDLANPRRVQRALEILRLGGGTPSARASTPEANAVRQYSPERPFVAVGLDAGEALEARVETRLRRMVDEGFVDEAASLSDRLGRNAAQAVGYAEMRSVVAGERSVEEAIVEASRTTASLAKRQRTYFRRDPRIRWLPWQDDATERAAAAIAALEEIDP